MKITEAIGRADALYPNSYTREEKFNWAYGIFRWYWGARGCAERDVCWRCIRGRACCWAFTAIVQGMLCAGASVYVNQMVKQGGVGDILTNFWLTLYNQIKLCCVILRNGKNIANPLHANVSIGAQGVFVLVQMVGIEPTRYHYHRILSPARLPVPPHLHILTAGFSR